jgi:iron-sulfur cluster repair protein YtfE (RIC family)
MTDPITRYLGDDHDRCDHLLAACEHAARQGGGLSEAAVALAEALERHFRLEEEMLFPELEAAHPGAGGPTSVMRMEHRQMRQLLADLAEAAAAGDRLECAGILETLHLVAQQHNAKEEGILYPMADAALGPQRDDLVGRMRAA